MGVLATDKWLEEYRKNKKNHPQRNLELQRKYLCDKLTTYFYEASSYDIHEHLLQNGLFLPSPSDENQLSDLKDKNIWREAAAFYKKLLKEWEGPDVPIFIFPVDINNRSIRDELNGKSGLAYKDKMILFLSNKVDVKSLQALISHEYNHVCRLNFMNQDDINLSLLDSVVLEGIAENAVEKRLGEKYTAKWTSIYSEKEARVFWKKWIKPHQKLKKVNPKHDALLYGGRLYPKLLGYNVGYHIVSSFIKNNNTISINKLTHKSTEDILKGSTFE